MLATTSFSFINIYLALKTSRNNAVVDLSESKTIEKRVIKESILRFVLEIIFKKKSVFFGFPPKNFRKYVFLKTRKGSRKVAPKGDPSNSVELWSKLVPVPVKAPRSRNH